MDTSMISYL